MSTSIEERTDLAPTDPGDHERFAHFIYTKGSAKAAATQAMIEGTPVMALCGKKWVPSRDPQRFPICPDCKGIKDEIMARAKPS